jgi:hypothetical protein
MRKDHILALPRFSNGQIDPWINFGKFSYAHEGPFSAKKFEFDLWPGYSN